MTTKLDTFTFPIEPEIRLEMVHNLARKDVLKKFGQTKEWMSTESLRITLTGTLTGPNAYADRDSILTLFSSKSSPVDFYSDTINLGSSGSPKTVWLVSCASNHPLGKRQVVEYVITLEEDSP